MFLVETLPGETPRDVEAFLEALIRQVYGSALLNGPFAILFASNEGLIGVTYEIIGTEGVILYDREEQRFELRNAAGTRPLAWHDEKNFAGMYAAFARALETGNPGDLPTGEDGLVALRIARAATEQAIADRR